MIITAKVKTCQPYFSITKGPVWLIRLRSKPEKGKANQELVRELSREYSHVRIVSGFKSNAKKIELI
jgi:uncharacterized protein YggU (UPF0235/DUF167 family)